MPVRPTQNHRVQSCTNHICWPRYAWGETRVESCMRAIMNENMEIETLARSHVQSTSRFLRSYAWSKEYAQIVEKMNEREVLFFVVHKDDLETLSTYTHKWSLVQQSHGFSTNISRASFCIKKPATITGLPSRFVQWLASPAFKNIGIYFRTQFVARAHVAQ